MYQGGVKENVLPQSVVAYINSRIAPQDSLESVIDHVIKVLRAHTCPRPFSFFSSFSRWSTMSG